MSILIYQKIWTLFNKYDFGIDHKLYSDLVCVICKKILQNACQSPCGCRYCYSCIENYLCGVEKCCPREIDDCNQHFIKLNSDLQLDHVANKKISLITVKCPEQQCQFFGELRYMTDHIESHHSRCPYFSVGCSQSKIDADHLADQNAFHASLLMDSMNCLRNEINSLREDAHKKHVLIDELRDANNSLKEKMAVNQTHYSKFERKTEETIAELKNEIKSLHSGYVKKPLRKTGGKETKRRFSLRKRGAIKLEKEQQQQVEFADGLNESRKASNGSCNNNIIQDISMNCFLDEATRPTRTNSAIMEHDCDPFPWKITDFMKKMNGGNESMYSQSPYGQTNAYEMQLNEIKASELPAKKDCVEDFLSMREQKKEILYRIWQKKCNSTSKRKSRQFKSIHSLLEEEPPSEAKNQLMKKTITQLTKSYYYMLSRNKQSLS